MPQTNPRIEHSGKNHKQDWYLVAKIHGSSRFAQKQENPRPSAGFIDIFAVVSLEYPIKSPKYKSFPQNFPEKSKGKKPYKVRPPR